VKTLLGITAPGILRFVVTLREKKRKNSSSARHYDQIRFRFHTAWTRTGNGDELTFTTGAILVLKNPAWPRWVSPGFFRDFRRKRVPAIRPKSDDKLRARTRA